MIDIVIMIILILIMMIIIIIIIIIILLLLLSLVFMQDNPISVISTSIKGGPIIRVHK